MIFPICSGMVQGFSRFVPFLFLGLLRGPTRNSPERVRDTIWTFPEKSGKHPGLETPRFSFSQENSLQILHKLCLWSCSNHNRTVRSELQGYQSILILNMLQGSCTKFTSFCRLGAQIASDIKLGEFPPPPNAGVACRNPLVYTSFRGPPHESAPSSLKVSGLALKEGSPENSGVLAGAQEGRGGGQQFKRRPPTKSSFRPPSPQARYVPPLQGHVSYAGSSAELFFAEEKWGPQRKDFGGGYGLPGFYRVVVSTTSLESFSLRPEKFSKRFSFGGDCVRFFFSAYEFPYKWGKLFYLQLGFFLLTVKLLCLQSLLDTLSHCKQKSSNCK